MAGIVPAVAIPRTAAAASPQRVTATPTLAPPWPRPFAGVTGRFGSRAGRPLPVPRLGTSLGMPTSAPPATVTATQQLPTPRGAAPSHPRSPASSLRRASLCDPRPAKACTLLPRRLRTNRRSRSWGASPACPQVDGLAGAPTCLACVFCMCCMYLALVGGMRACLARIHATSLPARRRCAGGRGLLCGRRSRPVSADRTAAPAAWASARCRRRRACRRSNCSAGDFAPSRPHPPPTLGRRACAPGRTGVTFRARPWEASSGAASKPRTPLTCRTLSEP
jgi:hypothetical protein